MEYSEGVLNFKLPFLSVKTNFQSLTMYKIGLAICTVRSKTVLFVQRYIIWNLEISIFYENTQFPYISIITQSILTAHTNSPARFFMSSRH